MDSASLQNANTRCNGLIPLWGTQVQESAFASCLARHNTYLQEATGHRDISYSTTIHDLKILLHKFANEESFSSDSGGGAARQTSTSYRTSCTWHCTSSTPPGQLSGRAKGAPLSWNRITPLLNPASRLRGSTTTPPSLPSSIRRPRGSTTGSLSSKDSCSSHTCDPASRSPAADMLQQERRAVRRHRQQRRMR